MHSTTPSPTQFQQRGLLHMLLRSAPNSVLEPSAASELGSLAVPSSLRSLASAQRRR